MITSRLRFEPGEMLVDQWQGDNRRSASSRLLQQVCLLVCVSGIRLRTNLPTFLQEFDIITVVVAFSSLARIWGKCSTIHSPPALYFFSFFFFLTWKLARVHLFHSLWQDQSTVVQRAETTVAECSVTNCV